MVKLNLRDHPEWAEVVERATAGEDVVIIRDGREVARVSRVAEPAEPRRLGLGAGRFHVPEDFDRIGEAEIQRLFEQGS